MGHLPSNARLGKEVSLTVRIVKSTEAGLGTTWLAYTVYGDPQALPVGA